MFAIGVAFLMLSGCGGGGGGSSSEEAEKAADIELLNDALAQELTAVDGLTHGLPLVRGTALALTQEFRAQEQEHVDALIKSIRGLGGKTDAEPSELELTDVKTQDDFFVFAYDLGSATIASHMSAIPKLSGSHLRVLFASIVADESQQLVVLRRGLGAGPLELVPEPFETGGTPAPGEASPQE